MSVKPDHTIDMTVGKPGGVILRFLIPVFLGNVLQQAYQLADTVIVGRCVGTGALAAVGSTSGVFFLMFGIIWGLTSGCGVVISQYYGAKNEDRMKKSIGNAVTISVLITLGLSIAGILGLPAVLQWMNTPDEIYGDTLLYIRTLAGGLLLTLFYNLFSCFLRAIGNSRIPLYFLIFASALNVVLDYLFMSPLGLGVFGAAAATLISQGIAAVGTLMYICRYQKLLHPRKKDFYPESRMVREELRVGIPMGLQYAITAIGMMILQSSLNLLGTLSVAAYAAGNKIETFAEQGFIAMGTAMATYSAQNLGAGRTDRIRSGVHAADIQVIVIAALTGSIMAAAGKYLAALFVTENRTVIMADVDVFMKIIGATIVLLGFLLIYRNTVQGIGYGWISVFGGVIELAARSTVAAVSARTSSFAVICLGYPVSWITAGTFFVIVYCRGIRILERKDRSAGIREDKTASLKES